MATEYGFVYILGNQSMPGIFKIGFTLGHPKARMEQLSGATACPTPFDLVACFGTISPREVEAEIHEEYACRRINRSREFFEIDPIEVREIVRRWGDAIDDMVHSTYLDALADNQQRIDTHNWKVQHFQEQCADPIFWPKVERGGFR